MRPRSMWDRGRGSCSRTGLAICRSWRQLRVETDQGAGAETPSRWRPLPACSRGRTDADGRPGDPVRGKVGFGRQASAPSCEAGAGGRVYDLQIGAHCYAAKGERSRLRRYRVQVSGIAERDRRHLRAGAICGFSRRRHVDPCSCSPPCASCSNSRPLGRAYHSPDQPAGRPKPTRLQGGALFRHCRQKRCGREGRCPPARSPSRCSAVSFACPVVW